MNGTNGKQAGLVADVKFRLEAGVMEGLGLTVWPQEKAEHESKDDGELTLLSTSLEE